MCLTNLRNCYAPVNVVKAIWLVHFSKKSSRLSSAGSEILTFGSHCSANLQPILDCFIPKFKLEYDDLENIKTDCVNTVVFNLTSNQTFKVFLGHPVHYNFLNTQHNVWCNVYSQGLLMISMCIESFPCI